MATHLRTFISPLMNIFQNILSKFLFGLFYFEFSKKTGDREGKRKFGLNPNQRELAINNISLPYDLVQQ
jgi:hypothetical protein